MLLTSDMMRSSLPKLVDISLEAKAWENLRLHLGKDIKKIVIPGSVFIFFLL